MNGSSLSKFLSWVVIVGTFSFFVAFQYANRELPLGWDEVDYADASGYGIVNNALERNSLNIFQFAQIALAKARHSTIDYTKFPSESLDPFLRRHFHPALPTYFWNVFLSADQNKQDEQLRLSNCFLGTAFGLVFLLTCLLILPVLYRPALEVVAGALSVLLLSDLFITSFFSLNFHTFFAIALVLYSGFLLRFLEAASKNNAVLLGLSGSLLAVTLETWVVPVAITLLVLFLFYRQGTIVWKNLIWFSLAFFLATMLLYPAFWLTLYPLKSWAFYLYRILFNSNKEYAKVGALSSLAKLIKSNLFVTLYVVISIVAGLIWVKRNTGRKPWSANFALMIGLSYCLFILPFMISQTYILPGLAVVFLSSTLMYGQIAVTHPKLKFIFILLAALTLAFAFYRTSFSHLAAEANYNRAVFIANMQKVENLVGTKPILFDGGHIVRYYLRDKQRAQMIEDVSLCGNSNIGLCQRENYAYVNLDRKFATERAYHALCLRKISIPSINFGEMQKLNLMPLDLGEYTCYVSQATRN